MRMSSRSHPPPTVRSSISRDATRTFHSGYACPSSSMSSATTGGSCSRDHRHHPGVAGAGAVAVFEVDRVDHASPTEHLQPSLDDLRLGGVQHDRQGGRGGEPAGQLPHVLGAVAADVVDAQVEQVPAVTGLAAATSTQDCQSAASIDSRNALEPLALVRSPTISTEASWANGTGW